jgi:ppGpp synthetase/RelA/SpoT-type nucleotidyltranferase
MGGKKPSNLHTNLNQEYEAFLPRIERALSLAHESLEQLLCSSDIKTHSLSSRLKSRPSLRYKISRPERTYQSLWDVTDLAGLRVTTYFEDTVEQVARLIESRFEVDFAHSTDKRQPADAGRFGYRSLHYVCRFPRAVDLPEDARFEIQIRTVLQHAWAEIEHDLGYKTTEAIPLSFRRRFSRLSSLLEIADQEFVAIRSDLEHYRAAIEAEAQPNFPIDGVSFASLLRAPLVREVDAEIAGLLGRELGDEPFFPDYLIKMLRLSGLTETGAILEALARHRQPVLSLVGPYFDFSSEVWKLTARDLLTVPQGYSLFFLAHHAVLESPVLSLNKVAKFAQFYRELDYPNDEKTALDVAERLVQIIRHPHETP